MFYLSRMRSPRPYLQALLPRRGALIPVLLLLALCARAEAAVLVFQSDFGLKDGAVAAMKGVAVTVDPELSIYDLTHEIPAYNIWEAALRLDQAAAYWPGGTVFVSVVDPGVGSDRRSVVLKTRSGHYFVSPDNGSLTFVAESLGVDQVREIDEATNRLKDSGKSYTFHGRDVYAYTGARLASGAITFEQVGPDRGQELVRIPYPHPVSGDGFAEGGIPILDIQYGNVWTNIQQAIFEKLEVQPGDTVAVQIQKDGVEVAALTLTYAVTFAGVAEGEPLVYMNSLGNAALAINQGSFADRFGVASGPEWTVRFSRADRRIDGTRRPQD